MTETTDLALSPAAAGDAGDTSSAADGTATGRKRRTGGGLAGMVLAELQQIAQGLGITGTGRMRKSQLIDAIQSAQSGGGGAPSGGTQASAPAADTQSDAAETTSRRTAKRGSRAQAAEQPQSQIDLLGDSRSGSDAGTERDRGADEQANGSRRQARGNRAGSSDSGADGGRDSNSSRDDGGSRDGGRSGSREGGRSGGRDHSNQRDGGQRDGGRDNDDDDGGRRRRRRSRDRFRDRRGGSGGGSGGGGGRERYDAEPQVAEDDVLIPVAGILDVLDNYAFVRTSGFLPGPNDVYVSLAVVKKYGLRKGDAMSGAIRQPRDGERREKFNPLVRVDTVNGADPELSKQRPEFGKLTPLYPQERLRLETELNIPTTRIIDLVAPIGKGQRALIVSPSKAGKTLIMQAIANAITQNNPEAHLMVVLVDERPEEVTDMQRAVKGEVIASTFDRPADDHTTVAELAIERAKRLVELGHDVVVLLDSITRLGRAYNIAAPASGRILSGGVDSSALYPPKRFFGAARNIEQGGSLTIIATALIETGSKADEVIFEEFKGTGNMEIRLRREFADKRIFPAIDVDASGTRREELLMGKEELGIVWNLRRVLSGLEGQQALELLLNRLKETRSNVEFLMQINKTMPGTGGSRQSSRDDD